MSDKGVETGWSAAGTGGCADGRCGAGASSSGGLWNRLKGLAARLTGAASSNPREIRLTKLAKHTG